MDPLVFLPQHVRTLVGLNNSIPFTLPQALREDFALVAIIDISGYSKLSSKLEAALGSDSGARIKEVINPPMDLITQHVHRYCGSIVKLAGDAVIACWTLDPDVTIHTDTYQKILSLNVLLCCLELLEVFHSYEVLVNLSSDQSPTSQDSASTPSPPQYLHQKLAIHIGLGVGPLDHIHVGGKSIRSHRPHTGRRRASSMPSPYSQTLSRREYFIAGEALAIAGANLNLGDRGDFLFPETFHATLQETIGVTCVSKNDAFCISDTDPLLEKMQLKAFKYITPLRNSEIESKEQKLPPAIGRNPMYLSHAKAYIDNSIAKQLVTLEHGGLIKDQLRSVSVVFIKFGGFKSETVAEPENLKQLQACTQVIVAKVQEYEGCVRQFNCDDKSLTALLVWGLEGNAHEKGEAQVAMMAATEIAKNMPNCLTDPEGFSIGVTTGVVFAGIVGSKERCDNTVLGVVVNNAARLMCLPMCHGTVLCDEETYKSTSGLFNYITDIPEVTLKGVPYPVKIYNPMGDSTAPKALNELTLISGREREMQLLEASLEVWRSSAFESKPKNCILIGPSGIGKTQLTSWLQEQIDDTEILCAGMGLEHKRESLLFSWIRIFHGFLDQITTNEMLMAQLEDFHSDSKVTPIDQTESEGNSDPSTTSFGFEPISPSTGFLIKDKYASEMVLRQHRPWSGRSDTSKQPMPVRPSPEIRMPDDGMSVTSGASSEQSNYSSNYKGKSHSFNAGRYQTPKEPLKYGTLPVERSETLGVPMSAPTQILKETRSAGGLYAEPVSESDLQSGNKYCLESRRPKSAGRPGPQSAYNHNSTSVSYSGLQLPPRNTDISNSNISEESDFESAEDDFEIDTTVAEKSQFTPESTQRLEYAQREPLKDASSPTSPTNNGSIASRKIRPASAGYVRKNSCHNRLYGSPLSNSGKSLLSKDNFGTYSPKLQSPKHPWITVSTRNSFFKMTAGHRKENGTNSPYSQPGESAESLNPNMLTASGESLYSKYPNRPRLSKGKPSTLGLGMFSYQPASKSPSNLHERISMSMVSESSSSKDKLPKLLRILNILSLPLSCIETLTPITGFSTGQSFTNGIGPLSLVLADIFNAFCDLGLRICIILDDIQWCDSYSLELTKSLLGKCPNVLFILTARPADEWRSTLLTTYNQIVDEVVKIEVLPLTASGVEKMLQTRLILEFEFTSVSSDLVKELLERGQGNPMVTDILINTLIEDKLVCVKNNCLERSGGRDLQLGMGSTAAVVAQFDKLSPQMKFLLRVFAISGQYFKLSEICAALNIIHSKGQESGIIPTTGGIQKLLHEQDKYKFVKFTDNENELCFSHYLIQQAIISSMVPADREFIRKAFIIYFEATLLNETGLSKSSTRQSLLFHLIKVPGDEEKKKYHVYEAFLECGEMNQGVEALEFYNLLSTFENTQEPADTCLKKIREYRILARLYFEKGDYEKALSISKQAFTVLGCRNSLVNTNFLSMLPNILSMVLKVEWIIKADLEAARSEAKVKEAALNLLRDVFPNAEVVSTSLSLSRGSKLKYSKPMNDEEQDKLFKEIITVIWVMANSYQQLKPGLEILLLSLMMTAPSLLSTDSRNYRMGFYFCAVSTMSRIYGFGKLSSLTQTVSENLFKHISSDRREDVKSLYDLFMFANIHSLMAKQRMLDTDTEAAATFFRRAFILTVEQGLGASDESYTICQQTCVNLQCLGNDEEILSNWFDEGDSKYYDKNVNPFFLAEAKSFVAASLACLNDIERANIFHMESTKHLEMNPRYTDPLRILHVHLNYIRVIICNSVVRSTQCSIAEHLTVIEECMMKIPLRVFGFTSWLFFCHMMTELALHNIQRQSFCATSRRFSTKNASQSSTIQDSIVRILKFVKTQFIHPKLVSWPFLHHFASALLDLWQTGKCKSFASKAEKAIQFSRRKGILIAEIQVTMLKSHIFESNRLGD